jgi:glycosyltransferase involved in cell wall biosynthesis
MSDTGFLEMKRDIMLRLIPYFHTCRKQKIKAVIGLCGETYWWKNHYLFEESKKDNYSFRILLSNSKMVYGKRDDDISKVCFMWRDTTIELYENMKVDRTIKVIPNKITEFEFKMYSSGSICNDFLSECSSLTTPPVIPESVGSIGGHFLSYCSSLTIPPVIPESVRSIGDYFLYINNSTCYS